MDEPYPGVLGGARGEVELVGVEVRFEEQAEHILRPKVPDGENARESATDRKHCENCRCVVHRAIASQRKIRDEQSNFYGDDVLDLYRHAETQAGGERVEQGFSAVQFGIRNRSDKEQKPERVEKNEEEFGVRRQALKSQSEDGEADRRHDARNLAAKQPLRQ